MIDNCIARIKISRCIVDDDKSLLAEIFSKYKLLALNIEYKYNDIVEFTVWSSEHFRELDPSEKIPYYAIDINESGMDDGIKYFNLRYEGTD